MKKLLCLGVSIFALNHALADNDPRTLVEVEVDVLDTFDGNGALDGIGDKSPDAGSEDFVDDGGADAPFALRGGPSNDNCSNAAIVPGNVITYAPPLLDTTGATIEFCEGFEDCEGGNAGVSNSVWYSYTPTADGRVEVNTFGSNYNTVLSVFDSCGTGFLPPCTSSPTQLACNDNASFGTQSQLALDVVAGQTYYIKVADYNTASGGGLLNFNLLYYPPNDDCVDAIEIPGVVAYDPPLLSTHNAQQDLCEASESCEFNNVGVSNSVWYAFTAPCDGDLNINTNGSTYDTILSVFDGCGEFVGVDAPCNLPSQIACDDDSGNGTTSQLLNVPVQGGQRYLIKVADYNTNQGGGWLDFNLYFSGAAAPTVSINTPDTNACACDFVTVTGTASVFGAGPLNWTLEARPITGNTWSTVFNGQGDVNNSTLAVWNTSSLAEGQYILRLTAENGCGVSDSAVELVYVSQDFDLAQVDSPAGGVLGDRICVDGSALDNLCFDSYQLDFAPSGTTNFQPVDPAKTLYTQQINTNPLGEWDTIAGGVPDGDYDIRISAVTQCGDTASDLVTVVVDNTAPVATIHNLLNCDEVDGVVEIFGTVSDDNIANWTLQVTGGPYVGWQTLGSGSSNKLNEPLAIWDTTTLPPCGYTLRLRASDKAALNCNGAVPHTAEATVTVNISSRNCPGDVDGDGDVDLSDLATLLSFFGEQCF